MGRLDKFLITAVAVLLPVLAVVSILIWSLTQGVSFLVGGGSTSVVPMMNDFLQFYRHADKGYKDMLYNAIGSSASLAGIRRGAYQFGFLSKTVDNDLAKTLWTESQVCRFVVARDPVMIIYNVPNYSSVQKGPGVFDGGDDSGLHIEFGQYQGSQTNLTLKYVMQQFYVQHQSWTKVLSTVKGLPTTRPQVISREEGSGTRSFFEKEILGTHRYKPDQYVGSNQLMLDAVANTSNSVGYLSFEYAKKILTATKYLHHVHVAAVAFKSKQSQRFVYQLPWKKWSKQAGDEIAGNTSYALYRPFTGIFRTTGRNAVAMLKFIAWMINPFTQDEPSGSRNAVEIIRAHGLVPIFPHDDDHYFQLYNDWKWNSWQASTIKLINKNLIYEKHQIPGRYQIQHIYDN